MLRKNDTLITEIIDMNMLGFGIAKPDGFAVFVSGAIPGDRARIRIIKVQKSYAIAKVEEILVPSPHRIKNDCPVSASCGGCAFRTVDYAYEASLKESAVRQSFLRQGLRDVQIAPLTHANQLSHYRNKAQFPVARTKSGELAIGFFAAKSHRVLDCGTCALQHPSFAPILAEVRRFLLEFHIPIYDETTRTGLLRHIYLRIGEATGEIMLCLVICGECLPHAGRLVERVTQKFPAVRSILLNVNKADTNVVLGERYIPLYGDGAIFDKLCGILLKITPASFYQVNREAAELLYQKAAELAGLTGKELLLDLYCGIGSIGLSMAHRARRLIGIEVVPDAVECAKENARLNGIKNAAFYCGDAADAGRLLENAKAAEGEVKPDVVILDPPRRGCAPALLEWLSALEPQRIVYISCNPETLARDVKQLIEKGYAMGTVYPFDLFCRTGHVETVCLLSKLNAKQHIEINLDMDELDLTDAEKKATYQEIKDYVLAHSGLKVSSLYIAQVKQKCGIIERENYNKPKSEDAKQPQCPPDKEKAIKEALQHFGMI